MCRSFFSKSCGTGLYPKQVWPLSAFALPPDDPVALLRRARTHKGRPRNHRGLRACRNSQTAWKLPLQKAGFQGASSVHPVLDVFHNIAHGVHILKVRIRDVKIEGFFQIQQDIDEPAFIRCQIGSDGGVHTYEGFIRIQLLCQNRLYLCEISAVFMIVSPSCLKCAAEALTADAQPVRWWLESSQLAGNSITYFLGLSIENVCVF